MKVSIKALAFVSFSSLVVLTGTPKDARACWAPLSGLICTGGALVSAVSTLVSFIPGPHNQHQVCNYGTNASCCRAHATPAPSTPSNCTVYQMTAGKCPIGETLYCSNGANVPAATDYQNWARPLGSVSVVATFAFAIAATAIFSMAD